MKRLLLGVCAVALVGALLGCGGKTGGDQDGALPITFDTSTGSEMVQIGTDTSGHAEYVMKGYHEISGVVQNPFDQAIQTVSVVVTVTSPSGETLHEETIWIRELAAGGVRAFSYRWHSEDEAVLEAEAVYGEASGS